MSTRQRERLQPLCKAVYYCWLLTMPLDVPEKVGELRWDSEDAIAAWNAAQAQMAAKLEVPDGISPKGRPNVTTPQTGNVSSRVGR